VLGETVCASRAYAQTNSCGTVTDDYDEWIEQNCGCTVHGDDSSIPIVNGDSGSPVYVSNGNVAIGVVDTTNGRYASLTEALTIWNISLRTP
jgi:hypothetical protein